jgi:hypothetical protein
MEELYFKCTLLTHVVLNNKMATEGNMTTLDYLSGSNFLGIVAKQLYPQKDMTEETFSLFHNGDVSFGDAYLVNGDQPSYHLPSCLFMDKMKKDLGKDTIWVHHVIDFNDGKEPRDGQDNKIQLKQVRTGYFNLTGELMSSVEKGFVLKSAYDSKNRRSEEGKMFGYEYLKKGQEFVFSIRAKNLELAKQVSDVLKGTHSIGKSKSAEFGLVEIKAIDKPELPKQMSSPNFVLVYAESNLCFLNEYGQATFQPKAIDLGVNGAIIWEKSQVRTYSYTPWNAQRNTPSTQRDCIQKGSVFYVETSESQTLDNLVSVGEYQAEGLGRVLYNPTFLDANTDGTLKLRFEKTPDKAKSEEKPSESDSSTPLNTFLSNQLANKKSELALSKAIQEAFDNSFHGLKKGITPSQWGGIRGIAMEAKDYATLKNDLFDKDDAFLKKGVAAENYWNKNSGILRNELKAIFEKDETTKSLDFVIKYTALMAKKANNNK